LANFLQSSVQGIQLQQTFGGIGRNIVSTGSTLFTVYGGFAWQQINYQQMVVPAQTQRVSFALLGTGSSCFVSIEQLSTSPPICCLRFLIRDDFSSPPTRRITSSFGGS
jgi:hypothetical protein